MTTGTHVREHLLSDRSSLVWDRHLHLGPVTTRVLQNVSQSQILTPQNSTLRSNCLYFIVLVIRAIFVSACLKL